MDSYFTLDDLTKAFNEAEMATAHEFEGGTCSMLTRLGENTCPICYFRIRVREYLENLLPPAPAVEQSQALMTVKPYKHELVFTLNALQIVADRIKEWEARGQPSNMLKVTLDANDIKIHSHNALA